MQGKKRWGLDMDTLYSRLTSMANQWRYLHMQVLSIVQRTKESTLVRFKH